MAGTISRRVRTPDAIKETTQPSNPETASGRLRSIHRPGGAAILASLENVEAGRSMTRASHDQATGGGEVMTHILRDLKHGIRLLIRKPGFTVVAVVTLALGMGANTAIFTVAHALILKPLPYSNPDELVIVNENNLSRGWTSFSVSAPNFVDWRAQTLSFAALAAYGGRSFNYSGSGTPER